MTGHSPFSFLFPPYALPPGVLPGQERFSLSSRFFPQSLEPSPVFRDSGKVFLISTSSLLDSFGHWLIIFGMGNPVSFSCFLTPGYVTPRRKLRIVWYRAAQSFPSVLSRPPFNSFPLHAVLLVTTLNGEHSEMTRILSELPPLFFSRSFPSFSEPNHEVRAWTDGGLLVLHILFPPRFQAR